MLHRGGHEEFKFLSDKLKPRYFWWEMVLLLRRLMIMIIAQSTTSEPLYQLFVMSVQIVLTVLSQQPAMRTPHLPDDFILHVGTGTACSTRCS